VEAYITAQAIGIVAMCSNVISYLFKDKRNVLLCQLIGASLFTVNMFMLDATIGALLNIVAIFRALVYMNRDKIKINSSVLCSLFVIIYLLSYVLSFTVFGKEPTLKNLITELLPVIGMTAFTVGMNGKEAKEIRIFAFINSPCWLIYNCVNFTLGGILCETFSLISNVTAFILYDLKAIKSKPKKQ
jgi:hypothetical protein